MLWLITAYKWGKWRYPEYQKWHTFDEDLKGMCSEFYIINKWIRTNLLNWICDDYTSYINVNFLHSASGRVSHWSIERCCRNQRFAVEVLFLNTSTVEDESLVEMGSHISTRTQVNLLPSKGRLSNQETYWNMSDHHEWILSSILTYAIIYYLVCSIYFL